MKQLLLITTFLALMAGAAIAQTPTISSLSPAANSVNAATDTDIQITFSTEMATGSFLDSTYVIVRGSLSGRHAATSASFDGLKRTITFDPEKDFIAGEKVTVRLYEGLANDDYTATLGDSYEYSFTVAVSDSGVGYFSGDSYYLSSGYSFPTKGYPADFDQDGDVDIILWKGGSEGFKLRRQNNPGDYVDIGSYSIGGVSFNGLSFADVDNDTDIDLFVTTDNQGSTYAYTYKNNGAGALLLGSSINVSNFSPSGSNQPISADVDNNGLIDFIPVNEEQYSGVWPFYQQPLDTFTEANDAFSSVRARFVATGDLNGDGQVDFVMGSQVHDSVGVLLSSSQYAYDTKNYYTMGSSLRGVVTGDVDGDGDLDIVVGSGSNIKVLFNDGSGSFSGVTTTSGSITAKTFNIGDMDGDGDLDLIFLTSYNSGIIAFNDGTGDFSIQSSFTNPGGTSSFGLEVFDADGDGDLDIGGMNQQTGSFRILKNGDISTPTTAVSSMYQNSNDGVSASIGWSGGNGTSTLILVKEGSAVDATPVDDTNYSVNDTLGNGSEIGTGNFVVYAGSGSSVSIKGLQPNKTYYAKAYEYNGAGATVRYKTDIAPTTSFTTRSAPTSAPSGVEISALSTSFSVSWSNGNGQGRIVLVKEGSAVDAVPTDSTSYTADAVFGSGDQLGTGNYVVYEGTESSVTVTGLTAETAYHVAVFEYDGTPGAQRFYTDESGIRNITTKPTPTIWSKNDSTLSFTKANSADWTQAVNQDRVTDNLWLTRADKAGLFNIADEIEYNSGVSPSGTQWAFGTTDSIASLTFSDWETTIDASPPDMVGEDMVVYIEADNLYFDITFTDWGQDYDSNGARGYSYTRAKGPEPAGISQSFQDSAGTAYRFDGGNTYEYYFEVNTSDPIFGNSFTTEMWVKPDTTNLEQLFLTLYGPKIAMGINSSNQFFAYHTQENISGPTITVTGTTSITKDQWYHVALTGTTGGNLTLYVNGVSESSASITDVFVDEYYWYIGSDYDESYYFYGDVDELRIWKSERTASEIRSFMHRPYEGSTGRLAAYWQFNEGTGGSAFDAINNFEAESYNAYEESWVASDAPLGNGTATETKAFQTGTTTIGNASLSMADGFDNPVDVQVTEVSGDPNLFPTGFTSGVGGKYFIINLFGDPGTFSANLTLNYGSGTLTSSNPAEYKLFKRSSTSTGEWTEIASAATSVDVGTGAVTWTGITSFSQFMAVIDEVEFDIQIADGADVVSYNDSTYEFASTFFDLTGDFADSALTINSKSTLSGDLFLDQNENGTYDDGTDNMLTAGSEFSYTPSGSTKLRYNSAAAGFETAVIKLQLGEAADSVSLDFFTVEGDPEIAGNSGENGWYLLSNPFTTTVGNLLSNIWTQGAINSDAPSGDVTLYRFVQDSAQYLSITTDLDTTKLAAGEGLLAYIFEDDDILDGEDDVDGGWPKTLTNYGNPFGTDVSIPVKNVDHDGVSGTTGSEGFVLLGNPYGWPLSADSLISKLKKVDELANSYVYRWNPTAKVYQLLSSGSIEPYESVFVRLVNSGTSGSLSFNYDDAVLSPSKITTPKLFELELSHDKEGLASISNLRFGKGGQVTIDPYDGYYLGSYATKYASLYTLVGDQPLTINNLPIDESFEKEFPMYLDATVSGIFKLGWAKDLIPDGMDASLVHVETGKAFDLNAGGSFEFNVGKSKLSSGAGTMDPIASTKVIKKAKQNNLQPIFMLVMNSRLGTSNELDLGIPTEVELYQNYPNPFNPASVIRFGVPNASKVKLEVFDVLGRKVMTLLNNETKSPGRYNVQFDARSLSSGMYIYRLVVGDKVMTKKMTLIK